MSDINEAWREAQRRRWLRPNWQLYVRPDAYRFAPPGSPEAKMPGWIDPSATRVRLKEAQEEEARVRAAAEQLAFESEVRDMRTLVDHLKSYVALRRAAQRSTSLWPQADRALERFNLAYARYFGEDKAGFNPNQPRAPAGNPEGGQWAGASTPPDQPLQQDETPSPPMVVAQAGFGMLVAEIPVPGGRRCVYNFGSIGIAVPGAANFRCSPRMHWSGATHGTILNDNFKAAP